MNILIVDDHRLFRMALIGLLKTSAIYTVDYDEAENGREALEKLRKKPFDLVLLDVSMPVMDGFETCKHIANEYSHLPVIILTQFDSENLIRHFLNLGVHSFLSKGASAEELIAAIESVKTGEKKLHPSAYPILHDNKQVGIQKVELTHQERLLLRLLKNGCTSKEIAKEMNLTVKSVDTYRERLMKKTQTCNVADLISFGYETGLLTLNDSRDVGKVRH